ncbi:hypothetical protein ACLB2K_020893 [Fragaria x ananassa]
MIFGDQVIVPYSRLNQVFWLCTNTLHLRLGPSTSLPSKSSIVFFFSRTIEVYMFDLEDFVMRMWRRNIDLVTITERMAVKKAVQCGNVEDAIDKVNDLNPEKWTPNEDEKLVEAVAFHGAKNWTSIASKAGLNRSGKSCSLRWVNHLRPNIKRGDMSEHEEDLIIRLHKLLGNRWSLTARRLPGRTDNVIKNYWYTRLSKKIQQKDKQSNNEANGTTQFPAVDEKPSVANDDQKVHVEMKQECLVVAAGTSAALIKKEEVINSEDYFNTCINNIDANEFLNLLNEEEPLSWEVPQIS